MVYMTMPQLFGDKMEKITSRKNKLVAHLRKLGSDRAYRRESGEYVCDGNKQLEEALRFGAEVTAVLYKGQAPSLPENVPAYEAAEDILEYASPLKNSPGPVFSVKIPSEKADATIGRALVLEGVQDPGNVGTVIRTANALNMDAVILTGDCADLYNPKTARAAMGALFRQRVLEVPVNELRQFLDGAGLKLYGAALSDQSVDIRQAQLKGAAVAVGSEGRGLSERLLEMCDGQIIIPMSAQCESLNAGVAAAIIMWELTR